MEEQLMEPIVLIDKPQNKEAHIVTYIHNSFEDVIDSAHRINNNLFKGKWSLSYLNKTTNRPVIIDKCDDIDRYIKEGVDTFYWNYEKSGFKIPSSTDRKSWHHRKEQQQKNRGYNFNPNQTTGNLRVITYANLGKRAVAWFIDFIVISIIASIFKFSGMSIFVWWLYFALLESSSYQATVGKMVLNLKVTDMYGNRINFLKATTRYFAKILSWVTFLLGFLMAAFTNKRQTLHDIVSDCLVLEVK